MSRAQIVIDIKEPYRARDESLAGGYSAGTVAASVVFKNGRGDQNAKIVSRDRYFDGDEARMTAINEAIDDVIVTYKRLVN